MRIVILDGCDPKDEQAAGLRAWMQTWLRDRGGTVRLCVLSGMRIGPCTGCFNCWVKTPGSCRIHDDGVDVARAFIQSDLAVFFSPVMFGSYNARMKKALDRLIGLLLPFLRRRNGEMIHPPRYGSYPLLAGIGLLEGRQEEWARLFVRLVERNARNLLAPAHKGAVLWPAMGAGCMRQCIEQTFVELGA